ncbi:MarC family protein [Motilibacter aurantiacus]|uniref:MarC family protein n=1 Tax=Motilibacter aurantiacus TaxID=2714955 RepID=UPI0014090FC8|nr:MarC family protein [Motilibacter aurantiacus]
MGSEWRFFGEVFVTLFVIVDPPGTIPLFLSLTSGRSPAVRRRTAWQAASVALLVITAFALFGQQLLDYLGITLPALQCAGGLLLLLVALQLLTGQESETVASRDVNVALVPLGTPLLAGPGAIVATMVFVRRVDDTADAVALAAGVVAVHFVLWLTMRYSLVIIRVIRESGVVLVSRIAGLLLSAIAVQLVADAVRAFVTEVA